MEIEGPLTQDQITAVTAWAHRVPMGARTPISVEIELCAMTSNQAVLAHLDGESLMGRLTYWSSGEGVVEIVDIALERIHYCRVEDLTDFSVFAEFERIMRA